MKIAKKVLAVVMTVAMIACFSAMAFAAEAEVVLKAGDIVDGKVKVEAVVTNGADLKAADWVLTYDAEALKLTTPASPALTNPANGTGDLAQIGTDAIALAAMGGNLMTAYNTEDVGVVKIAFAFKEALGTDAETILFTTEFDVVDADAKNIEVALTGSNEAKVVINKEAVEETTTEAPETTTEAPSTDAPTTAAGDTGANKPTDTSVAGFAIAAGVVALAGAAFVVSKKRK